MMQYHLNGYKSGDPSVAEQNRAIETEHRVLPLPCEVDVLIVGCGPAGLTLAAQLAQFSEIKVCIVDQKPGPLMVGQADGIACRTMEMFQAFGFADQVMKEAYWVNETAFWKPEEDNKNRIVRHGKVQDVEDGLSEFPHVILNQARVHDFLLESMVKSESQLVPHYARTLANIELNENAIQGDYPLKVSFQNSSDVVRARYVVGCDGARSTVRKSIGLKLKGDSVNQAWGVMDVLAITDFPDVRFKNLIQSAAGSMLIIPREGGYLIRLYVELGALDDNERVSAKTITADELIAKAQQILKPYTFDVKEIAWWSVYQIGQRLCDKFDDVPPTEVSERSPRVFIAGDACHTHSPKAGQGMNVSMRDSFNLGWKLAGVILGRYSTEILHTYSAERQGVAKELIEFDQRWSKMVSSSAKDNPGTVAVDPEEFQNYFVKHGRYTAGTAIQYKTSVILSVDTHQYLARGFKIGTRFHSAGVIRLGDAKPVQLGHTVKADGRWRLFLFADAAHPSDDNSLLAGLCELLQNSPDSPLRRYAAVDDDIDGVIDVRAVFQQSHRNIEMTQVPSMLLPRKGCYGLHDYEKCFCIDHRSSEDIYKMRDIDTTLGCMIVVRPDQHIADVLPLSGYAALTTFFDGFML